MMYLYSWNILSPNIYVNSMLWKSYSDKSLEFAKLDKKRFHERKEIILKIINSWLNGANYVAICLQEVCNEILEELLKLKYNVFYTNNSRMVKCDIMCVTIIKGYNAINEELNITETRSVLKTTFNNINLYNVHLHWKWEITELKKSGTIIYESIDQEKYIICGDMNKNSQDINPFLDEFDCIRSNHNKSYTGIYPKTGYKDCIDHIFISPTIEPIGKIKVGSKVLGYKIMYNIEKMVNMYSKGYIFKNRKTKDISDHKPIRLLLKIKI